MMRQIFLLLILFSGIKISVAQQEPQFSQFMFNKVAFNPSFTGTDNALSTTFQFRNQWTGLNGHPVLQNFNIHTPLQKFNTGAGVIVMNDISGALRNTNVMISFCKRIPIKKSLLNFGLSGGILQSALDGEKLRAADGNYNGTINHNDNLLPTNSVNGIVPDISAGISFISKKFETGISVNHMLGIAQKVSVNSLSLHSSNERIFDFYTSKLFHVGRNFSFTPSVLLKSNLVNIQQEANAILIYKKYFWVGAGYRGFTIKSKDALIGYLGIKLSENFKLGYSYDYNLSALSSTNNGSHELLIIYQLKLVKPAIPGKVVFTPRN